MGKVETLVGPATTKQQQQQQQIRERGCGHETKIGSDEKPIYVADMNKPSEVSVLMQEEFQLSRGQP